MSNIFRNSSVLVINDTNSSRKMMLSVLRILGIGSIGEAPIPADAFLKFKEKHYDVVIASLTNGTEDAISFAKQARADNSLVPILALTGPKTLHLVDQARETGVTDLLQCPFTVDDVSTRLKYVLSMEQKALQDAARPQEKPIINAADAEPWPDEDDAFSLTDMLLEHYLKHHEIVFAKLKFAQNATKRSIEELRSVHEKIKQHDNTNIHKFSDFDTMWEEIIKMFIDGGLSEGEIAKIESLITTIPEDIKKHYDGLSQQDKSFLSLVEGLNADAYKKAKSRVTAFQAQPNPLNGKTAEDYKILTQIERDEENANAFIFEPVRKK